MRSRERYGTRFHSIHRWGAVKKTRPPTVALGILNMMLPIIVAIRTCLFLINRYWLMRNRNEKEKREKASSRHEILPFYFAPV